MEATRYQNMPCLNGNRRYTLPPVSAKTDLVGKTRGLFLGTVEATAICAAKTVKISRFAEVYVCWPEGDWLEITK